MSDPIIKEILQSIYKQQDTVDHAVKVKAKDFGIGEWEFQLKLKEIDEENLAEGIRPVYDGEFKGCKTTRLRLTSEGEDYINI